jgi:hypothetical protein
MKQIAGSVLICIALAGCEAGLITAHARPEAQ